MNEILDNFTIQEWKERYEREYKKKYELFLDNEELIKSLKIIRDVTKDDSFLYAYITAILKLYE